MECGIVDVDPFGTVLAEDVDCVVSARRVAAMVVHGWLTRREDNESNGNKSAISAQLAVRTSAKRAPKTYLQKACTQVVALISAQG